MIFFYNVCIPSFITCSGGGGNTHITGCNGSEVLRIGILFTDAKFFLAFGAAPALFHFL
jgi:hypothetical protein